MVPLYRILAALPKPGRSIAWKIGMGYAIMALVWLAAFFAYFISIAGRYGASIGAEVWFHGIWMLFGMGAVATVASIGLASRLTSPLKATIQAAKDIAKGDFRPKVLPRPGNELDELADTVNALARTLEEKIGALSRNEMRLQAILDNMVSGVMLVNAAGKVELCNAAAGRMVELEPARVRGRHYLEVIRNSQVHGMIEDCLKNRVRVSKEISLERPKNLTLEITVVPIDGTTPEPPGHRRRWLESWKEGEGAGALITLYDITEVRHLERARSELVANISHELKTPLTVIKGFAETLVELTSRKTEEEAKSSEVGSDSPDVALYSLKCQREECADLARTIYEETERLSRLVQDLLDLARMESGKLDMNWENLDLVKVVTRAARTATPLAAKARLSLELFAPEERITVRADATKLEQSVFNLIHNAVQYTPPGGHVSVSVSVVSREGPRSMAPPGVATGAGEQAGEGVPAQREAVIKVCDTGPGIPPDDLPRIFQRFYRVEKHRSRATGGTGLGLAIVKHIVEAHGGKVSVESTLGKGSCFFIRLPLATES